PRVTYSTSVDEPHAVDACGSAIDTLQLLADTVLHSAYLVPSHAHARRSKLTFDAGYAGRGIRVAVHAAPDSQWRKLSWWQQVETRHLTFTELQKLAYIFVTGQYH